MQLSDFVGVLFYKAYEDMHLYLFSATKNKDLFCVSFLKMFV